LVQTRTALCPQRSHPTIAMASPLASRDPKLAKPASSPSSPTATGSPTTASDKSSSAETQLDKDTILALQKELLDIFTAPGVQKKLREIRDSGVKCPTLAALLDTKEQRKLLEKYGLDASLSDLKDVTYIWRNFETDPDVYVNHASIQEALGFSTVKDQDVQMPKGYKQPLNKQSLIRLMKSLLKSYSEPDFQAAIEDMKRRADASKEGSKIQKDGYYHLPGREAVAFAVQEQLLPCFGLQATREGVTEMIKRCAEHLDDPEVAQLMDSVNAKLGMSSAACERFRKICKDL